jgi:hypothetical protein
VLYWLIVAALVIAGSLLYLLRMRRRDWHRVTDDMIEQIVEVGTVELDEPLDLEDIADEETRFWEEERWDEADEF